MRDWHSTKLLFCDTVADPDTDTGLRSRLVLCYSVACKIFYGASTQLLMFSIIPTMS